MGRTAAAPADISATLRPSLRVVVHGALQRASIEASTDANERRRFGSVHAHLSQPSDLVSTRPSVTAVVQLNDLQRRALRVGLVRACVCALPVVLTLGLFVALPAWYSEETISLLLPPSCELFTPLTWFILNLFGVLISAFLAKLLFFRAMFADTWKGVPPQKKAQATSDLLKILVRVVCFAFCVPLWTRFTFDLGLNLNTFASCDADFPADVVMRMMFNGVRYLLSAVMAWDMCASSDMPMDIILHHVMLIVGGVIVPDSFVSVVLLRASRTSLYVMEGFSFVLFFGATLIAPKEAFVLAYRCVAPDAYQVKATLLRNAEIAHAVQAIICFVVLPVAYLASVAPQIDELGVQPTQLAMLWVLLAVLLTLEGYIAYQTHGVRRHMLKKATIGIAGKPPPPPV